MKSPTYILKKPHLERMQQIEYLRHVSKVQNIVSKHVDVNKKYGDAYGLLKLSQKNREKANRFKESETIIIQERENRSLSLKLLKRKVCSAYSQKNGSPKNQPSNYFQRPLVKREQQRILIDNYNLASRIVGSLPIINKDKQDKQYQEHLYNLNSLRRFHKQDQGSFTEECTPTKPPNYLLYSYAKSQKNTGIFYQVQFEGVSIKNILICPTHENSFFYEVFLDEEQIIRSQPLAYEDFCHVQFQFLLKSHQYEKELVIKLWKLKQNMEVFMGQMRVSIDQLKNILDYAQQANSFKLSTAYIIEKSMNTLVVKWGSETSITKQMESGKSLVCGFVKTQSQVYFQNCRSQITSSRNRVEIEHPNPLDISMCVNDDVEQLLEEILTVCYNT